MQSIADTPGEYFELYPLASLLRGIPWPYRWAGIEHRGNLTFDRPHRPALRDREPDWQGAALVPAVAHVRKRIDIQAMRPRIDGSGLWDGLGIWLSKQERPVHKVRGPIRYPQRGMVESLTAFRSTPRWTHSHQIHAMRTCRDTSDQDVPPRERPCPSSLDDLGATVDGELGRHRRNQLEHWPDVDGSQNITHEGVGRMQVHGGSSRRRVACRGQCRAGLLHPRRDECLLVDRDARTRRHANRDRVGQVRIVGG